MPSSSSTSGPSSCGSRKLVAADLPGAKGRKRLARCQVFLLLEGAFAHNGLHGRDLLIEVREDLRELVSDRT